MGSDLTMQKETLCYGLNTWKNPNNKMRVFELWYYAHPAKDEEWAKTTQEDMSPEDWQREHCLSFIAAKGKRVFPEFTDVNVGKLSKIKDSILYRGWDFGYHHPCCIFVETDEKERVKILAEMMGCDLLLDNFAADVIRFTEMKFGKCSIRDFCDPAGGQKSDKREKTSIQILNSLGIHPQSRKTSIEEGLAIIRRKIMTRIDNISCLIVDEGCKILIDGFRSGYHYPDNKDGFAEKELPANDGYYEHSQDGLRYIMVGLFRNRVSTREQKIKRWRKSFNRFTGVM